MQSVRHKEDTMYNLKEQTGHILSKFLDDHEDDVDGYINNAGSFNSIDSINSTQLKHNTFYRFLTLYEPFHIFLSFLYEKYLESHMYLRKYPVFSPVIAYLYYV